MSGSRIEWCDVSINPIVGCSKCSPGCEHCYAERFAARLVKNPNTEGKYEGVVDAAGRWTGRLKFNPDVLRPIPGKGKRVFIGSMCDLFHEAVLGEWIDAVVQYVAEQPQHTFMFLTKRPDNMRHMLCVPFPLPNLWLGVTVCHHGEAQAKIPLLLGIKAALHFASVEPMLGPVTLPAGLDWVICGGETGLGARPPHPNWVRSLRDQCAEQRISFFFKSWGGVRGARYKRFLDGVEYDFFPGEWWP